MYNSIFYVLPADAYKLYDRRIDAEIWAFLPLTGGNIIFTTNSAVIFKTLVDSITSQVHLMNKHSK